MFSSPFSCKILFFKTMDYLANENNLSIFEVKILEKYIWSFRYHRTSMIRIRSLQICNFNSSRHTKNEKIAHYWSLLCSFTAAVILILNLLCGIYLRQETTAKCNFLIISSRKSLWTMHSCEFFFRILDVVLKKGYFMAND